MERGRRKERKKEGKKRITRRRRVRGEEKGESGRRRTPFRRMAFPAKRIGRHGAGVEILRRAEGARLRMTGWWSG